jgi:hypothetical protein
LELDVKDAGRIKRFAVKLIFPGEREERHRHGAAVLRPLQRRYPLRRRS